MMHALVFADVLSAPQQQQAGLALDTLVLYEAAADI